MVKIIQVENRIIKFIIVVFLNDCPSARERPPLPRNGETNCNLHLYFVIPEVSDSDIVPTIMEENVLFGCLNFSLKLTKFHLRDMSKNERIINSEAWKALYDHLKTLKQHFHVSFEFI
jgi:hypothetical protein